MSNNVYRFRRIKWGEPKRFKAMPQSNRLPAFGWDTFAIVVGLVVIGAVLFFLI